MKIKIIISIFLIFFISSFASSQSIKDTFENGKKAFYSDKFDDANNYFSQILALESDNYENCYYKGMVYEINFDNEKAMAELTKAIGYKPKTADTYYHRGKIYEKQEKYLDAIQDYTSALKYDKKDSDIYFDRASAYQELKQYSEAIKDYTKVIKLNPSDDITYYNRGLLYKEMKNNENAIEDFETAIKIDKAWERELGPVIEQLRKGQ
jgi:tetratricopeptide (TPR) repeat protein